MANYVLLVTTDPFDSSDVEDLYSLAEGLAEQADEVTVFLVQNGVLPVRKASAAGKRVAALAKRTSVLADEFSLRERGIRNEELAKGVTPASIDTLVDLVVEDGRKVIWH